MKKKLYLLIGFIIGIQLNVSSNPILINNNKEEKPDSLKVIVQIINELSKHSDINNDKFEYKVSLLADTLGISIKESYRNKTETINKTYSIVLENINIEKTKLYFLNDSTEIMILITAKTNFGCNEYWDKRNLKVNNSYKVPFIDGKTEYRYIFYDENGNILQTEGSSEKLSRVETYIKTSVERVYLGKWSINKKSKVLRLYNLLKTPPSLAVE